MKVILWLLLILSADTMATSVPGKGVEAASATVKALIGPLIMPNTKMGTVKFSVEACRPKKIDWVDLLLLQKTVELDFKFKQDCDIEGIVRPKAFTPFPSELKLQNLPPFDRMKSQNRLTASIESRPVVHFEVLSGELSGSKDHIKFEADYRIRINPLSKDKSVEENLGGEIRILELNGKKVSITEKLRFE